jgi:hypothetical protein
MSPHGFPIKLERPIGLCRYFDDQAASIPLSRDVKVVSEHHAPTGDRTNIFPVARSCNLPGRVKVSVPRASRSGMFCQKQRFVNVKLLCTHPD